jgi:flagellar biosynthesis/type III secretory pathway chaperone
MSTAEQRVGAVVGIASRLIEIMNSEISVLRNMRIEELAALQEEKNVLVTAYENAVGGLQSEPEILIAVNAAVKQEFAETVSEFNKVLADNERALHAAQIAHDRLLKAVIQAVEEVHAPVKTYSANGAIATPSQGGNFATKPLSLNASL